MRVCVPVKNTKYTRRFASHEEGQFSGGLFFFFCFYKSISVKLQKTSNILSFKELGIL